MSALRRLGAEMTKARFRLFVSTIAAAAALTGGALAESPPAAGGEGEIVVTVRDPAGTSPAFLLIDQDGNEVTERDYRGRILFVAFGYSHCPDICPTALQMMAETMDLLGPGARRVVPVFITFDPERDTPAHLKTYLESFHPALIGLSGRITQTDAAAAAFGAVHVVTEDQGDGNRVFAHSAKRYVVGPDGAYLGAFGHDTPPEDMAGTLRAVIDKYLGRNLPPNG